MRIITVVGARPQFIKAAVVSRALAQNQDCLQEMILHTGQHYDPNMSDVFFSELKIPAPSFNLGIGGGTHGRNTGRMIEAIETVLLDTKPHWVLVYGDTDSTLAGAIAACKLKIPVAHVEAGLRSFNRGMPEEANRVLTDHVAELLFTPSSVASSNLANEGISSEKVRMVGDVMYDAMLFYAQHAQRPAELQNLASEKFVLCTIHRAGNTDTPQRLAEVVRIINEIASQIEVVIPMHPRTAAAIGKLKEIQLSRQVHVVAPVGYLSMLWLLRSCDFVVTDSGGLQKEAYFARKACITLRDETEWVELVTSKYNYLCPPGTGKIATLLEAVRHTTIPAGSNLYGDGAAGDAIAGTLLNHVT